MLLGVHRYTQDVLDESQEQNGSGYRVELPAKLQSIHFVTANERFREGNVELNGFE